jgi:hypothetical protein
MTCWQPCLAAPTVPLHAPTTTECHRLAPVPAQVLMPQPRSCWLLRCAEDGAAPGAPRRAEQPATAPAQWPATAPAHDEQAGLQGRGPSGVSLTVVARCVAMSQHTLRWRLKGFGTRSMPYVVLLPLWMLGSRAAGLRGSSRAAFFLS